MKKYNEMTVPDLINRMISEIPYEDDVTIEAVCRPGGRKELLRRGSSCFPLLGTFLQDNYANVSMTKLLKTRCTETVAMLNLLWGLVEQSKRTPPYDQSVGYGDQKFSVWITFCFSYGQKAA